MDLLKTIDQKSVSHNEKNDCAVRAVSIVTNYSYDDVHYIFSLCGRKQRHGTKWETTEKAVRLLRFRMVEITNTYSSRTIRTLERELKRRGKNRLLVRVRGHVLPVVNGKVYDWTSGRCHRIQKVYRLVEVSEEFHQAEKRNIVYTSPVSEFEVDTTNLVDVTSLYKQVGCRLIGNIQQVFLTTDKVGPVFLGKT